MSVLPRLDDLIGLAIPRRHNANRVLNRHAQRRTIDEIHEELYGLLLSAVRLLCREPPRPAYRKVVTWRMRHDQAPPIPKHITHVALQVLAWPLGG